jgi:hypothetical protein
MTQVFRMCPRRIDGGDTFIRRSSPILQLGATSMPQRSPKLMHGADDARGFPAAVMRFLLFASLACAQAIPDLETLLKEVQANQHKMDEIRENYTFHRAMTEEDLDDKGAVVKTTTTEREFFFVNGRGIGRLVKKNGVPLNPQEEKKEDARVKNIVETAMKMAPKARRGRGPAGLIGQILPMVKISNPRRITFHGRSTLAFDFVGDPHANGKGTEENAAKKMAGSIWFDEADHQVARLEVHFYENFRIGGGLLASVQKGSTIEVEQAPIGDGLWMQTSHDQHVNARIVVKNFRQNVHTRNTDFKKFNVDVLQQISPPGK